MLRTTKSMKERYEKIQNYLFTLIPEKWEEIYLYASVNTNLENGDNLDINNRQSGEMFFYYLPKGILKKRIINVYEVPQRFNINEEQYLKIVEELYECIKKLKQDFVDTGQELWTNLTISIVNFKFRVEYKYDELPANDEETYIRNVIWRYRYLKIGGDSKEDQKILSEYFLNEKPTKKEIYETGLYIKTENNSIEFGKEDVEDREFMMYNKEELVNIGNSIKNKFFGSSTYTKDLEKDNYNIENQEKKVDVEDKDEKHVRNQILDS